MSFYGKTKQWRQALIVLQEMQEEKIAPDTITYNGESLYVRKEVNGKRH